MNPFTTLLGAPTPTEEEMNQAFGEITLPSPGQDDSETIYSTSQLSGYDTDGVLELKGKSEALLAKRDAVCLTDSDELQAVLNELDQAIGGDARLDLFSLDLVRNHVKTVMITLSKMPEFSSILLDRDVRNVIKFARDSFSAAQLSSEASAIKATVAKRTTAPKHSAKAAKLEGLAAVMAAMANGKLEGF